jgi:hypothetical protein
MDVNRNLLWVLIGVCSTAGVAYRVATDAVRGFYTRHDSWREGRATSLRRWGTP